MPQKAFLVTTALVLCVSMSSAGREIGKPGATPIAVEDQAATSSNLERSNANAEFLAWYGHGTPHNGSTVLYEQSASSGFSTYAIPSWKNDSAPSYYGSSSLAADDFIIPGTGTHHITALYAPGTGDSLNYVNVTFFDELKYDKKTKTTTAIVKATCNFMPFMISNGGDLTVDVSSCNSGKFKAGHDYAVSIQGLSPGPPVWSWQTNRKQIKRQAFWYGHNNSACNKQLTPVKICYSGAGYGPDLAFAIYGK